MPTNARKRHRVGTGGPWGTGLLLLGVAVLAQGLGYMLRSDVPDAIRRLTLPTPVWAGLWIAAGAWCIWQALTPPQKHTDVWPVVGITCLWSAAYAVHWFILGFGYGNWSTGWSAAVGWGGLACLIISWARCVNPPTADPR